MDKVFKIRELEQVRLLADPLKLDLLQAFAERDKTAKAVADELGQPVTRLYRHVDALLDAGLLTVVQETPKRGTVERTFRAIASRFEADHALFGGDADSNAAVRDHLRAGEDEIVAALAQHDEGAEHELIVTRLRVKGSRQRVEELRAQLADWLENLQAEDENADEDHLVEVGAMIAFYPIVENPDEG